MQSTKRDDDDYNIDMHSPMPIHFPEKVHMKKTTDEVKYIMPPLDLTRTKNKNNNSTINNNKNVKEEEKILSRKKNFEIEEWIQTMSKVGLTPEEMERYINNKIISKLIDSLENLIKIIIERNINIQNLTNENMTISSQNSKLKTDSILMTRNFITLKDKCKDLENKFLLMDHANENSDVSMVYFIQNFFISNKIV